MGAARASPAAGPVGADWEHWAPSSEGQVPQELGGLCGTAGDIVRGGYVSPLLLLQRMATSSAAGNGTGLSSRVLVDGRLGGAGRKVPAQLAPRGPWGDPLWLPPASSGRLRSLAHTMPRGSHLRVTCALTDTPASLPLPVWSLWTGRDHLPGSRSLITSTKSPCYVG